MLGSGFPESEEFKKHLESLPLKEVRSIYEQTINSKPEVKQIKPLRNTPLPDSQRHALTQLGLQCLSQGKVAVLMMAGGQGTRLGYDKPKGMFDVGLPSRKSLFQIYCEKLIALEHWVAATQGHCPPIKFLVMASDQNQPEILHFFQAHHYFAKKDVLIFPQQASYPILALDGSLLLDSPGKVLLGPNGNGAFLESMHRQGLLKLLLDQGVDYIHFAPVDNVLLRLADPLWVGYTHTNHFLLSSKEVKKTDPHEKVGIHVEIDGSAAIVEYSEMTDHDKLLRDERGQLVFNSGGIGQMMCHTKFLLMCSERLDELQKKQMDGIDICVQLPRCQEDEPVLRPSHSEVRVDRELQVRTILLRHLQHVPDRPVRGDRGQEGAGVRSGEERHGGQFPGDCTGVVQQQRPEPLGEGGADL